MDDVKRGVSFVSDATSTMSAAASLVAIHHLAQCVRGVAGVNPKVRAHSQSAVTFISPHRRAASPLLVRTAELLHRFVQTAECRQKGASWLA